jgi:predicted nucleic acid-binding protein
MATGFIDTSVVIDYLRGHLPAYHWLRQQSSLGITPIVWLETVGGEPNKQAQRTALASLKQFELVYLSPVD